LEVKNLHTERLTLIPVTYSILEDVSKGGKTELEKIGIFTDGNWPTKDDWDIIPIILKEMEKTKTPSGFEFWIIVRDKDKKILGDIGFHGKPDEDGSVEIGYGLVEDERGKGYGFEALNTIIAWAKSHPDVKTIKADCLIDNYPSIRILTKAGMKEVSRDEELIYWRNQ
jgi:Acetyltransferases, including N-acetylases of ribosomal proteins